MFWRSGVGQLAHFLSSRFCSEYVLELSQCNQRAKARGSYHPHAIVGTICCYEKSFFWFQQVFQFVQRLLERSPSLGRSNLAGGNVSLSAHASTNRLQPTILLPASFSLSFVSHSRSKRFVSSVFCFTAISFPIGMWKTAGRDFHWLQHVLIIVLKPMPPR